MGQLHINYLHSKGLKLLNIIKMLRGVWWGSHPSSLLIIYRMVIRASIEYGCFVFAGVAHNLSETRTYTVSSYYISIGSQEIYS
jgi:hypothetical protein